MNSEYMPEQKGPAVTFDNYVIPDTVREVAPPLPADPVPFAPAPAPASALSRMRAVAARACAGFRWTPVTKGVAAVAFFILGAFIGYLLSGATGAAVATHETVQALMI